MEEVSKNILAKSKDIIKQVGEYNIRFYPDNEKYRFEIEGNKGLSDWLVSTFKSKRVKERDIKYVVDAIAERLQVGNHKPKTVVQDRVTGLEVVSQMNLICQDRWGENPIFDSDVCENGFIVTLTLPNAEVFSCTAASKREARREASKSALAYLCQNEYI